MDSTYYLSLFLDEGHERLQQLGELFLALERTPEDREVLAEVFRNIHSFKGMADTMDFADLVALTHAMEGLLDVLRHGALALTPAHGALLSRCLDVLATRIGAIEEGRDEPIVVAGLEADLLAATAEARPEAGRHPRRGRGQAAAAGAKEAAAREEPLQLHRRQHAPARQEARRPRLPRRPADRNPLRGDADQ